MNTHTPANDARRDDGSYRSDGDYKLNGKTLCGKSTNDFAVTTDQPTCGQCARNLRTVTGSLRDGRPELHKAFRANTDAATHGVVDPREIPQTAAEKKAIMDTYYDTSGI